MSVIKLKQLVRAALGLTWHDAEICEAYKNCCKAVEAKQRLYDAAHLGLISPQELALKLPSRYAEEQKYNNRLHYLIAAKEAWRNTLLLLAACASAILFMMAAN